MNAWKKQKEEISENCDQKDETIDALNLKIKEFKKQLEMSGLGANKNAGELGLLRKNVTEMESIIKTKDFEIKKLKNKASWSSANNNTNGLSSNPEDAEKINTLESELQKEKQKLERIIKDHGDMKQEMEKNYIGERKY